MTAKRDPVSTEAALVRMVQWAQFEPVQFATEVLQLKRLKGEPKPGDPKYNPHNDWALDDWLIEMLEAVADVDRKRHGFPTKWNHEGKQSITVRACRGPGKTFGIAVLAHIWGFAYDPLVIAVLAPKLMHIKTRFMGEFQKISGRAVPGYSSFMRMGALSVHWNVPNPVNHFLIAETAKHPENIQGLRRKNTLYLVDESSGVEESLYPVTDGNMAATDLAVRVTIGNPTKNLGFFARSHLAKDVAQDFYRMHVGPQHSRRVERAWVDRMIRNYGETSPVVRVHCFGEFASNDERQLVALEWVTAAFEREFTPDGSQVRKRVSVDVADGGDDDTVVTMMEHYQSLRRGREQRKYNFPSSESPILAADAAVDMWERYECNAANGDDIVVDSIGVGAGTAGDLMRRGYPVVTYKGGEASADPQRWRNRRVQSFVALRNEFRDGLISFDEGFLPDHESYDEFVAQLCSVRTAPGAERTEDLMTKKAMKDDGIKSPDRADGLAMQYATKTPRLVTTAQAGAPMGLESTPSEFFSGYAG